ncbi:ubiquinol oxidase subunit II [Aureimonas psammosilenae]|uniref:ubiquinol oxidase subunit II n=1 Tax=Aureimonas psammosilenae TaxID=2495496 RepID=UPI0012610FCE|nr:ubiquinol oxidase subunit II [Aureimonas psammosilenae]
MRSFLSRAPGGAARFLAGLTLAALGGCNTDVMFPTGDIALQQRNLILVSTALMLLIIVPVLVMIVVFAWRYRKGAGATYDPHFDHSTSLELLIWSCPLLIIICLGALTWSSTHLLDPFRPLERLSAGRPIPAGSEPLDVQVVAMDWKWLFIYPSLGVASVNELALPVDVPVRFSLTATSQMNTFYAPTLAGMIYTMPGMRSMLHAVINQPGESWGYSGNYTGAGYSHMRFRLRGLDQAGFDRWIADVKNAQGTLDAARYVEMVRPSQKEPAAYFGSVSDGLFDKVLNRCVEPGKPCEAATMSHDGHHGMTPSHEAEPITGSKPVPAFEKAPEDKGSGPNVTKPAPPESAPGQLDPGNPQNRGM